jgi:hypothetical protein
VKAATRQSRKIPSASEPPPGSTRTTIAQKGADLRHAVGDAFTAGLQAGIAVGLVTALSATLLRSARGVEVARVTTNSISAPWNRQISAMISARAYHPMGDERAATLPARCRGWWGPDLRHLDFLDPVALFRTGGSGDRFLFLCRLCDVPKSALPAGSAWVGVADGV